MAIEKTASKSLYTSAAPSSVPYTLKAYFKENSTSTENNTSNITVKASFIANGQYWQSSHESTLEIYWIDNNENAITQSKPNGTLKASITFKGLSGFYDSKEATATFNVPHKSDGSLSGYAKTIYTKGSTTASQAPASNNVATDNTALTSIPRQANLLTAQDFTDEGNPTITYENKAGNSVTSLQACIANTTGSVIYADYRDISKTGNSYTFYLTAGERQALRQAITTTTPTMQVRFYVKTVIGSNTFLSTPDTIAVKTMTLINYTPVFTNFTFADTNATTTALTGNNQYCILNYSNITATISTANKATARKEANMYRYQLQIGSATPVNISYSDSSSVSGTINKAPSGTFVLYAIDDRGNSTPVTKTAAQTLSYTNIYANPTTSSIARDNNGIGTNATLTLKGTFWNASFGSVTNTIQSVTYKYKKTDSSSWTTGTTSITPTVSGNNISFSGIIAGDGTGGAWAVEDSYNIQVTITDKLSSSTINLILNSGTPTIALAKDGVAIKGKYDTSIGGALQVYGKEIRDLIYPVGSIYLSTNSTDPQLLFGGTWEQIKGRYLIGTGKPSQNSNTNHGSLTSSQLNWDFTAGSTFGEYYHTLSVSEMPSHNHTLTGTNGFASTNYFYKSGSSYATSPGLNMGASTTDKGLVSIANKGGDGTHNNIPPSLSVYMWKRIA